MPPRVILLSIPGLRQQDLAAMPNLQALAGAGSTAKLSPSFPALTCPVQANLTTGRLPREHGVIANGFFWRDKGKVEMWTAWNECIQAPQIWDQLHERRPGTTSAVWFALHSKGSGADYVCTPAPIHNPDGSESLWCYTKPTELYGKFRDSMGHFPLQHFWGPLANIKSSAWIAESAIEAAREFHPDFFYIYLPHLDYAAQKTGPDSPAAQAAVVELDGVLGKVFADINAAYAGEQPLWLIASEYTIQPVDHVSYPNRVLREAGLLQVRRDGDAELLDLAASRAWALVDHQIGHVFVRDADPTTLSEVAAIFRSQPGIAQVLVGSDLERQNINHARSGEVVLVSEPNSWQAYYWWFDDELAPKFARTVDIHRKPGYDPVEMHIDRQTMSIPLDATLTKGSHGAPMPEGETQGILIASRAGLLAMNCVQDIDVAGIVLKEFGV